MSRMEDRLTFLAYSEGLARLETKATAHTLEWFGIVPACQLALSRNETIVICWQQFQESARVARRNLTDRLLDERTNGRANKQEARHWIGAEWYRETLWLQAACNPSHRSRIVIYVLDELTTNATRVVGRILLYENDADEEC